MDEPAAQVRHLTRQRRLVSIRGRASRLPLASLVAAAALAVGAGAGLPQEPVSAVDLTRLSIEELTRIEVTLVSRRPEKLADAAAAVFALGREDIRQIGRAHV